MQLFSLFALLLHGGLSSGFDALRVVSRAPRISRSRYGSSRVSSFMSNGEDDVTVPPWTDDKDATVTVDGSQLRRNLFIFGLGNVGRAVADVIAANALDLNSDCSDSSNADFGGDGCGGFASVVGTVRTASVSAADESDARSSCSGLVVRAVPFEDSNAILESIRSCTHVLVTIPPNKKGRGVGGGDVSADRLDDEVLDSPFRFSEVIPPGAWVGYISTTSVYGDHSGGWVDESSDCRCLADSAAARYLDAERRWREMGLRKGWTVCIFRCSGLYGRDFSAAHTVMKLGWNRQERIENERNATENHTSRIHLEDVGRAVVASMMRHCSLKGKDEFLDETATEVYNLADDEPAPRAEVMRYAAQELQSKGIAVPDLPESGKSSSSDRSRRRNKEHKKVVNSKTKVELLKKHGGLKYRTYKEGISAIVESCCSQWMQNQS